MVNQDGNKPKEKMFGYSHWGSNPRSLTLAVDTLTMHSTMTTLQQPSTLSLSVLELEELAIMIQNSSNYYTADNWGHC